MYSDGEFSRATRRDIGGESSTAAGVASNRRGRSDLDVLS